MLSTLVLDAPTGIGGPGSVRASARGCAALLAPVTGLQGSGLPWGAQPGADRKAPGGALPAVANRRRTAVVAVPGAVVAQPFATTTPYSTLGIHPPGRPRS